MHFFGLRRLAVGVGVGLLLAGGLSRAEESESEGEALRDRVEELDQQVKIINRKLEIGKEESAANAKSAPVVFAGKDGFGIKSADDAFRLRIGGTLQADARWYIADENDTTTPSDNFLLRRARPTFEGTLYRKFGFRIMPEFAGSSGSLLDLFIDANLAPQFRLRAGKMKGPVGLERLQSASDLSFVERAFPTQLVPNRDVGLQLHGDLFNGTLNYAAGIFDGTVDGASVVQDNNTGKDFEGRLYARPFKNSSVQAVTGLNFGVAFSTGSQAGASSAGNSNLPTFVTPGQQNFFAYASGAFADGKRERYVPQFYYSYGPIGVLGEYALSKQKITRSANQRREVSNAGWQVALSWVLTGEDAGYTRVTPRQNFDGDQETWGAFELVARVSELKVDDDVFAGSSTTRLADPSTQARKATDHAVGLNWHLNRAVKVALNYEHTTFEGGATAGDRKDEKVIFTRFQIAY